MAYVFDLEKSAKALRLNRFLHSLTRRGMRDLFLQDPNVAMKDLIPEERAMVTRLDWKAMQDYGASFFCLEKLARTKGVSNPEMVAHFRGETLEQFLKTRRVPGAR
jgi:gallate dioxygenase